MTEDILAMVRSRIGRRWRITRDEMRALLVALVEVGVDLRNGYVRDTLMWDGGRSTDAPLDADGVARAADAWVRACKGITCISVGDSLRDGQVRYDDPGSMHPQQHSPLLFACSELRGHEYDQIGQLRRHASRVLVVED